ncbi:hypothetical protein GYA13_02505 [Candidatus Kuenenbacteria bacterium]|nr:hypothetical protein [Candidatus Kuenenbacteria bacterium]
MNQPQSAVSETLSPVLKFLLTTGLSPALIFIIILFCAFLITYLLFFSEVSIIDLNEQLRNMSWRKKINLVIFLIGGICIAWIFFKVLVYDDVPIFLKIISEKIILFLERASILK